MIDGIHKSYSELFGLDNMFIAWMKFRRGKTKKWDIMRFERHLEDNIFSLHEELMNFDYCHGEYQYFLVYDSKKRNIHKASVRDRVIHQIIYDYLVGIYEPLFIGNSYSSRKNKGSHKAIDVLKYFLKLNQIAHDGKKERDIYILKCDIKKYFENIDHQILFDLIMKNITDRDISRVIRKVINSFPTERQVGVPLGNITSQIFANIYLHRLDLFIKNVLRARFYVRYNDDFIIVGRKNDLLDYLPKIRTFLDDELNLELPENKVSLEKSNSGVDFLGYKILPNCLLLRDKTKAKMYKRADEVNIHSYLGILKHCNSFNLKRKLQSGIIPVCPNSNL